MFAHHFGEKTARPWNPKLSCDQDLFSFNSSITCCEKAEQWQLALEFFQSILDAKLVVPRPQPQRDVLIFKSSKPWSPNCSYAFICYSC